MVGPIIGPFPPHVAHVAAAVVTGVAVEDLGVEPRFWNADAVVGMGLGREVADRDDEVTGMLVATQEGDDAVAVVATVNPFKAIIAEVLGIE